VAAATDGSDHLDMPAEFSDAQDVPPDLPRSVVEELTRRTPGFTGWQQTYWLYHCTDGAAYLGPAGYADLEPHPDALEMLRDENRRYGWSEPQIEEFLRQLDRVDGPTAYLFRCLHCDTHLAFWDVD
jgi:uncharacterized protein CbrC (UPF0167 family)